MSYLIQVPNTQETFDFLEQNEVEYIIDQEDNERVWLEFDSQDQARFVKESLPST